MSETYQKSVNQYLENLGSSIVNRKQLAQENKLTSLSSRNEYLGTQVMGNDEKLAEKVAEQALEVIDQAELTLQERYNNLKNSNV